MPDCNVDRALPRHTVQPLAPPTPRMSVCYASWTRRLAFAHHDTYAVDPIFYAATYTISTGASPMGHVNPLLGQRVHRAMKRIRGEILNRCSTINVLCAESLSASLSTHPLGLGGCTTPPGCGSPQTTTLTLQWLKGSIWFFLWLSQLIF